MGRPSRKANPVPWIIVACVVLGAIGVATTLINNKPKIPTATAVDDPAVRQEPGKATKPATDRAKASAPDAVTKASPFENSLGMKFVQVPITAGPSKGKQVMFSIWETRVKDYAEYASSQGGVGGNWRQPDFSQTGEHPVTLVSWYDAVKFCKWLTAKERKENRISATDEYRLPTDVEWSFAVGIGDMEDPAKTPNEKDGRLKNVYPWGTKWPPPQGAGNYSSSITDTYVNTSPVGIFTPNSYGLYDMGGNVWEWCEDKYKPDMEDRVCRGGSCGEHVIDDNPNGMVRRLVNSSCRFNSLPDRPFVHNTGFRCVLIRDRDQSEVAQGSVAKVIKASKTQPFVNSLGMKLVPVKITGGPSSGQQVLFNIWETRVQDYRKYAAAMNGVNGEWKNPGFKQGEDHPVVNVGWENAVGFCEWLTRLERSSGEISSRAKYRLPTDHEWSCAVGIGDRENAAASPESKDGKLGEVYPWGSQWPPPRRVGNYDASLEVDNDDNTSPVGSFPANAAGICDLGGNAWELCEDLYKANDTAHVVRGGSWNDSESEFMRSSCRTYDDARGRRGNSSGFRVVLEVAESGKEVTKVDSKAMPLENDQRVRRPEDRSGNSANSQDEEYRRKLDSCASGLAVFYGGGSEGKARAKAEIERGVDALVEATTPNLSPESKKGMRTMFLDAAVQNVRIGIAGEKARRENR